MQAPQRGPEQHNGDRPRKRQHDIGDKQHRDAGQQHGAAADLIGFFATAGLNLSSVSLTNGGTTLTADKTTEGFSFDDVASGTYQVSLSGMLTNGLSLFGTQYGLYYGGFKQIPGGTVPQIPEPETYALLLAGLLTIGFVARRRSQG